jgi:hypothetical protein
MKGGMKEKIYRSWQLAVGSWQLAVGSWQLAVGSWQKKRKRRSMSR